MPLTVSNLSWLWPGYKCVLNFGESEKKPVFKHLQDTTTYLKVADFKPSVVWKSQIDVSKSKAHQEEISAMLIEKRKRLCNAAESGREKESFADFAKEGCNKAKLIRWAGSPDSCLLDEDFNEPRISSTEFVTLAAPGCMIKRSSCSKAYFELHIINVKSNPYCQAGFATLTMPRNDSSDMLGVRDFVATWCVDGLNEVRCPLSIPIFLSFKFFQTCVTMSRWSGGLDSQSSSLSLSVFRHHERL